VVATSRRQRGKKSTSSHGPQYKDRREGVSEEKKDPRSYPGKKLGGTDSQTVYPKAGLKGTCQNTHQAQRLSAERRKSQTEGMLGQVKEPPTQISGRSKRKTRVRDKTREGASLFSRSTGSRHHTISGNGVQASEWGKVPGKEGPACKEEGILGRKCRTQGTHCGAQERAEKKSNVEQKSFRRAGRVPLSKDG